MIKKESTKVFQISKTKEVLLAAVFTALAVYSPVLIHYLGGVSAGRKFLPMPFFVLLAGLMLGWRAGLVTALASPVISFLISGMPKAEILPFIIVQLCAYGIVAGLMRERFGSILAVLGAIVSGWITIGVSLFLFSKMSAWNYVAMGARDGIWGILVQLIVLPVILFIAGKNFSNEKEV